MSEIDVVPHSSRTIWAILVALLVVNIIVLASWLQQAGVSMIAMVLIIGLICFGEAMFFALTFAFIVFLLENGNAMEGKGN